MTPPRQLPSIPVGRTDHLAAQLGFGAMGLCIPNYSPVAADEERFKVLDRAWELGCTTWDLADAYGDSEDLVGKWLKIHPERRDDIFIATKFGLCIGVDEITVNSSPEYCIEAAEKSLTRLGIDCIDLYYCHRTNPEMPIENTVEAMKKLKEQGKIKALGLSEISSATLRRAFAIHPIAAVQVEYNPWDLDIEGPSGTNLLDTCNDLGVSIFAYSPLGRGMLAGRYKSIDDMDENDARRTFPRFQPENFNRNIALAEEVSEIAKRKGCTAAQLVLAWLMLQAGGKKVFVIPGTQSVNRLEENVGAVMVDMTTEEEKELRVLVERANIVGDRNPTFGNYLDTADL